MTDREAVKPLSEDHDKPRCRSLNPWAAFFARMVCPEPRQPLHHSWRCIRCGMVFDD